MFYSKSTGGFYSLEIHGASIPEDAVKITAQEHAALLVGQSSGQRISADQNGGPILAAQPAPTPDQLHSLAKLNRDAAVSNIIVTTQSGKAFDGDETSQGRMSRAIIGMDDADVMPWKLADNTVASVNRAELREALRLSGAAQSSLWFVQ